MVEATKPVAVERIRIHGTSLEGNLEGDAVDRDVLVFLPPSYAKETSRRYPVIYALHGYSIGAEQWAKEIHVPQTIEGAFAQGAHEMIVVLPDSKTAHNGSMYSSSVTTGDFERYVSEDVVTYIDAHYRTIPDRRSRGLVGHSMGGYGATRIGMKRADVFGSLYSMSPCCLSARPAGPPNTELENAAAAMKVPTDSGQPRPDILAKWAANAPLAFVDQYIGQLRRYRGISLDVGDQDGLKTDTIALHEVLERYGIAHGLEVYSGTHTRRVADRVQNHVLPFFSRTLCVTGACQWGVS